MDTTTLMMMMAMSGGRNMNQMLPLLMLSGGLGGNASGITSSLTPNNMMLAMAVKNPVMRLMLGGTGAMVAGTLLGSFMSRPRRQKTRVVYRNSGYRRNYRRRY